jgi:hypothetical protein
MLHGVTYGNVSEADSWLRFKIKIKKNTSVSMTFRKLVLFPCSDQNKIIKKYEILDAVFVSK